MGFSGSAATAIDIWYTRPMSMTFRTIGTQTLTDQLRKELAKIRTDKYSAIGIHEDAPAHPDTPDLTMATIGAILNFGTEDGHIPARPWLEPGVNQATPDVLEVLQSGVSAGTPMDTILEQIGLVAAGAVQEYMTDLRQPPNAPSTIAAKGSDNPLIDTGALRAAVTSKTMQGKPQEGIG